MNSSSRDLGQASSGVREPERPAPLTTPDIGDNWPETRMAIRRLKRAWRGMWAQLFLNWSLRMDREVAVDFLWNAIEDEIQARKQARDHQPEKEPS